MRPVGQSALMGAPGEADTLGLYERIDPDAASSGGRGGDGQKARRATASSGVSGSFSRSLISAARKGEVVRLTSDAPMQAQSIMALGIQTALCAPISIGPGRGEMVPGPVQRREAGSRTKRRGGRRPQRRRGNRSMRRGGLQARTGEKCTPWPWETSRSRPRAPASATGAIWKPRASPEAYRVPPGAGEDQCVKCAMRFARDVTLLATGSTSWTLRTARRGVLLGDVAGRACLRRTSWRRPR